MARLLARRLATAAAVLFLVTLLVSGVIRLAPGDPLTSGPEDGMNRMSPQTRDELRRLYRLDQPFHRQYLLWLGDLLQGDLGRSPYRGPVRERIAERLPVTLTLNGLALLVMVGVALPLGAVAAGRPGSAWDRLGALSSWVLYAVPAFWAALLLQEAVIVVQALAATFLSVRLDWPLAGLRSPGAEPWGPLARGFDRLAHLVLPVTCLSYAGVAYLSRFVRATLLEAATVENWRAARARGLSTSAVLWRHGMRQAGVPLLTLAGFLLPALVSGSVVVERIFALPGLGLLFVEAATDRDLPVMMGLTLLSAVATLAGILVADLTYALVDPRVRRD